MFETYDELMERKLAQVSEKTDKRQGSVIFDTLAPNAAETAQMYADLKFLENRTYGDTATGIDLTRRAAERGVFRKEATATTGLGVFKNGKGEGIKIPLGSRFNLEKLNFFTKEARASPGQYTLECESVGRAGSYYTGKMLPVEYVDRLATAEMTEILTEGTDEEDDDSLRRRYLMSFDTEAFGGNIADYKRFCLAQSGVAGVKIYPVWNGGGTVKVVFIDDKYATPKVAEVEKLQEIIDPKVQGSGSGIAPIGHVVTVEGVNEKVVNVVTRVTCEEGFVFADVVTGMRAAFEKYFIELRKQWADTSALVIRISYLETRALEVSGILDIQDTVINEGVGNLILDGVDIPVLGLVREASK